MRRHLSRFLILFTIGVFALIVGTMFLLMKPPVSSASFPDDPADYPAFANDHPFSIYVLSERESPCHIMAVYDLARKHYGDMVLTWGVREIDGVNYVIAFSVGTLGGRFDPRQRQIGELMVNYQEPATCEVSKAEVAQLFPVINH